MKVVIACDSFKGCLSSREVATCIEDGILLEGSDHQISKYSIGDGGEGTLEAFHEVIKGELINVNTVDAYFQKINTEYLRKDNLAVIEAASVLGLSMYPRDKRFPLYASSYGLGLLIRHAITNGCKEIIIALGGTCTNDGGFGILQALGMVFYDENNNILNSQPVSLERISRIDNSNLININDIKFITATDVKNKLLGDNGATYMFGKQKGLFPNQMKRLERGLSILNECCIKQYNIDLNSYIGGGAAGGIGATLQAFLNASNKPGLELLSSYCDLEDSISKCDIVITGEGQSDIQTQYGKVPSTILDIANKYNKPVIIISGALGLDYLNLYNLGFAGIYSIADRAMTFQQALEQASPKLSATAFTIFRTIRTFSNNK